MDAEAIAEKARKKIGKFCFEECGAYCCRKGYIVLSDSELALIKGKEEVIVKMLEDGRKSMYLGNSCPSLGKNFKCKIHKNPFRPLACKNFPIYVQENRVMLCGRCLAVREGKLYPFIKQWLALGYKVYQSSDHEDFDLTDDRKA